MFQIGQKSAVTRFENPFPYENRHTSPMRSEEGMRLTMLLMLLSLIKSSK